MLSKGDRVSLNSRIGTVMRTDAFLAHGVVVRWDDDATSSAFFGEEIKQLQLVV